MMTNEMTQSLLFKNLDVDRRFSNGAGLLLQSVSLSYLAFSGTVHVSKKRTCKGLVNFSLQLHVLLRFSGYRISKVMRSFRYFPVQCLPRLGRYFRGTKTIATGRERDVKPTLYNTAPGFILNLPHLNVAWYLMYTVASVSVE